MDSLLSAPATAAQRQRDRLLGALIGLARATVNEPKTEDTDHVLAAGLRQAAAVETTFFFSDMDSTFFLKNICAVHSAG